MFYYDFTLIYTDGSKSFLGLSSALFIPKTDLKKSISIHKNSIFSAKLYRVLSALRWISLNKHRKNVIITDSCSVLLDLESKTWSKHCLITKILLLYNSLYQSN